MLVHPILCQLQIQGISLYLDLHGVTSTYTGAGDIAQND